MMKALKYISLIVLGLGIFAGCDTDFQFPNPDTIPQYPIKVPIISAKATATNGYSMFGTIEATNQEFTAYAIDFKFDANGIDLSRITVELEYCPRTIHKDNALEGAQELDLNKKSYTMTVNNYENDIDYVITASVVPCAQPVLTASATSTKGELAYAEVDNVNHTIVFSFTSKTFEIANLPISITYNTRATKGENAFDKETLDLSEGKTYQMKVNDAVEDLTYTISAKYLDCYEKVDFRRLSAFRVDGDCLLQSDTDPNNKSVKLEYMFDGEWVSKYGGQANISHHKIHWEQHDDSALTNGDFILFQSDTPIIIAKAALHPYNNYTEHDLSKWAIYAYKVSTTEAPTSFSTTSSDWIEIIEADDSGVWDAVRAIDENQTLAGTDADPLTKTFEHGIIEGVSVPSARYFALYEISNFYKEQPKYFTAKLGWNPSNRWHQGCFTELEIWEFDN